VTVPWRSWRGGSLLRFAPTRRLAAVVAAASLLWLLPGRGGSAAELAIVVVAAVTGFDWFRLPARQFLAVTRTAPGSTGIGDRVEGTYAFASRWPHALTVELYDRLTVHVQGGVGCATVVVGPAGAASVPFGVTGIARGRAVLGAVGLRVRTTLGLVSVRYTVPLSDAMLVTPSVSGVRRLRLLAMQHRLDVVGIRALRRRGEGRGFAGLRDYVLGDDPRDIDWKATARRAKLTSREYTIERSQTVITLIDAGRNMTQLAGRYTRFEHALSSALVLTDVAVAAGDRVGTLVFDDEVRAFVPALQSRGALRRVRDAFVPLTPTLREPDYATAFRFLAAHQRKRALIVFFTDVIDARASQALVAHVARSAARHLVLVVALRNDAVFEAGLLCAAGSGPTSAYETAAAEELIEARESALERMRRSGVVVLDLSPRVMTAGVVNRYLEIKGRGAL
jgi:uncharacterized protein (DUF58 family)